MAWHTRSPLTMRFVLAAWGSPAAQQRAGGAHGQCGWGDAGRRCVCGGGEGRRKGAASHEARESLSRALAYGRDRAAPGMAAATALGRPAAAAAAAAAAAGAGARRQRGRASRAVHGEAAAAAAAPTGVLASVSEAGVATVKLGRNAEAVAPRSAHAADLAYVEKLEAAVSAAAGNSCVHTVVLDLSAPDFMALGDHMSLAVARAEQVQAASTPHKSEPQLPPGAAQALLRAEASLAETWSGLCESKLCVAVLGDVVSSLGLALALPCALRVAAHSTVVQTPEAMLGLPVRHGFASAACHTLGPEWSLYLALTGQPLPLRGAGESDPRDLLATGIATHLTPDESLEDLLSSLGTAQTDVDAREAVDALGFGLDDRDTPAGRLRATVEECFCGPQSITDVDSALQKHAESAEEDGAWAAASRDAMHLAPPAACAAIFAHIRGIVGAQRAARRVPPWPPTGPSPLASVAGALDAEYRLTLKVRAAFSCTVCASSVLTDCAHKGDILLTHIPMLYRSF